MGRSRHVVEPGLSGTPTTEAPGFAIPADAEPGPGVRSAIQGQLDSILAHVEAAPHDPGTAVHEIRKSIKRVRAALRLVRSHLGEEAFREENARYRDAGRLLGPARDADVNLTTLDLVLTRRHQVGETPPPDGVRLRLDRRRRTLQAAALEAEGPLATVGREIETARTRAAALPFEGCTAAHIAAGLRRSYEGGARCGGDARGSRDTAIHHDWRKRAKDLSYQLQLLEMVSAASLRPRIDQQDRLTDLLGEANDLAVLSDLLDRQPRLVGGTGTAGALVATAARMRERRWRLADRLGRRLYRAPPEAVEVRVRNGLEGET